MKSRTTLSTICKVLLLLFIMSNRVYAQAPAWLWAHNEGRNVYEESCTVATDAYNNIYSGGYYNTFIFNLPHSYGPDGFLVKYDPAGNAGWTTAISDTGRERVLHIGFDKLGHYYIVGIFDGPRLHLYGQTFVNAENNANDIFVAKFDTMHNFIWARHIGGKEENYPNALVVDSAGNCYITGWYNGAKIGFQNDSLTNSSPNYADIFLTKYDPNGNVVWATSAAGASGGSDKSESIAVDKLGNSYITGSFNSSSLNFGGVVINKVSNFNMFVAKYSPLGNVIWAKRTKGTGDSYGYAVAIDPQMNCFVSGSFKNTILFGTNTLTSAGNQDIFIAKYAPDSTVLWSLSATGGTLLDAGSKLASDSYGYCYATGYFNSDSIRFGNWNLINNGSGFQDIYLTVIDPYGNIQWAKSIGGTHNDYPNAIAVDADRNPIIGGVLASDSIIIGSQTLYSAGSSDFLIVKSANSPPSGVEENAAVLKPVIYPNPAHDVIYLNLPEESVITLYNMQGQACREVKGQKGLVSITVNDLASGVYLLHASGKGTSSTGKIIKE